MRRTHEFILVVISMALCLFAFAPARAADFYFHTTTIDILDNSAPTATAPKFRDSPALNRTAYQQIGIWSAGPLGSAMKLDSLGELRVWVGLKNSGDQGTHFDLKAEVRRNGIVMASGETTRISGVTHNPNLAREVTVPFGAISNNQFAAGDLLSVRILTKVADSGGRNGSSGLRMYYDAVNRASRFQATYMPFTPLITIHTPVSGAVVSDHHVLVTGRFDASHGEVGINVNGYVALQDGDEFATFVSVDDQTTSITATVSDTSGTELGSHSIPVTVQLSTTEPVLTFRPFPAMALVAQPVGFTLVSLNEISQIELDGNGDGTIDFTGTSLDGVTVTFAEPGIYFPTVRVTDTASAVHTDMAIVQVVNEAQLDIQLRAKWDAMKNALRSGNTVAAASYIVASKRTSYETVFKNLNIPFSSIDQMLGNIIYQVVKGLDVEYEMLMDDGPDGIVSYLVLFTLDEDGVWRISFF